ncbi:MAG: DNA-processing protein DprA [Henriciella sp.]|nr:DNA-processing protein DprA [Henriciella sp.]
MTPHVLSDEERFDWLRLAPTQRVGPVTFAQLLQRFGSPGAALQALPGLRKPSARSAPRIPSVEDIEAELSALSDYGAKLLCSAEAEYPPLLRALAPPPPVIAVLGDVSLAHKPTVALVGARDASAAGRKIARDMAARLSAADFVTVSGLARGIDGEVHAASLSGGTIAVLGGGIDHIYPPQHERLYAAIAAEGLIVSESPFGHRAQARDFPRRNRIITGLSMGVVVIEAAERSGSLISARTAAEQGREVMAVPGSPLDPRAAGTNRLLREGALLVRDTDDVIEALSSLGSGLLRAPPPPPFEMTTDQPDELPPDQIDAVRIALSTAPMTIDVLARAAGIGPARCAAILMELELAGEAITLSGGLAVKWY